MRKPAPNAFTLWTDLMLGPTRAMLDSLQASLKPRAPRVAVIPPAGAPGPKKAAKPRVKAKRTAKSRPARRPAARRR